MSRRAELRENVLASQLETVIKWGVDHAKFLVAALILVVIGALATSVVIIRRQQARETAAYKLALAEEAIAREKPADADALLKEADAAGATGPVDLQVRFFEGVAAIQQKKYADAIPLFQDIAARGGKSPIVPLALANLGFAYEQSGKPDDAVNTYRTFMANHPDHFMAARVQLSLGRALIAAGQADEGRKALEQLVDLYPTSPWADTARSLMDQQKGGRAAGTPAQPAAAAPQPNMNRPAATIVRPAGGAQPNQAATK